MEVYRRAKEKEDGLPWRRRRASWLQGKEMGDTIREITRLLEILLDYQRDGLIAPDSTTVT